MSVEVAQLAERPAPPPAVLHPVCDRREGSPAQQMRADLERFRAAGLDFDTAWEKAYARTKWPHDTQHRREWKAILLGDRGQWRRAYEGRASATRAESAVATLT